MNQAERKNAFRVAYEFAEKHPEPSGGEAYLRRTLREISGTLRDHPGNDLLKWLLIGVYDYLSEEIKRGEKT